MAKMRLDDTIAYLKQFQRVTVGPGGSNQHLTEQEVADFESRVRSRRETLDYTGDLLSLELVARDDRPDEDTRHAIRLCLLASACASRARSQRTARLSAIADAAVLKDKTMEVLRVEIVERVRAVLRQTVVIIPAAEYALRTAGGPGYAIALSTLCESEVEDEMLRIERRNPGTIGVMLIDMQSRNVGTSITAAGPCWNTSRTSC